MSLISDLDVWWPLDVVSINEFSEVEIDGMPTTRLNWGDVKIKNKPFNYKTNPINRYRLFDFIMEQKQTTEIRMKLVSAEFPDIKGYFGLIDCDVSYDQKTLTVTLTPLDDYTTILENREKEVNVFQDANVVRNGMFAYVTGSIPDSWNYDSGWASIQRLFVKEKTACGIEDIKNVAISPVFIADWNAATNTPTLTNGSGTIDNYYACTVAGTFNRHYFRVGERIIYNGTQWVLYPAIDYPTYPVYLSQTIQNIISGKQLTLSFLHFLSGSSNRKKKLTYDIFISNPLVPTLNYRLKEDGTWTGALGIKVETTPLVYDSERGCIPLSEIQNYRRFIKHTSSAPISGTIEIIIYRPIDFFGVDSLDENYKLIITNVEFSSAEIPLKTIQVKLSGENLKTFKQGAMQISWDGKKSNGDDMVASVWGTWKSFINSDGSPNLGNLGDPEFAPKVTDRTLTYVDLISFFDVISSPSYKFELSELTIFEGTKKGRGTYRYAIASFSREEIYKKDVETYIGSGIYEPPALDSNWERMVGTKNSKGETLWVRTPFRGIVNTWVKGTESISTTLRKHDEGFSYYNSLSTKKAYPIDTARQITVETAIDLRDFIQKVYRGSHPDLLNKNVYSTFFWNDEDLNGLIESEDIRRYLNLLGNNSGCNYVTMSDDTIDVESKNMLNNISVIHTYDLSAQTSETDEKSFLKVSFKKLMDDLMSLFRNQIYWFVDSSGHLHIEHLKYFDRINQILDLTLPEYSYIRNYQSWKYDKAKMFSLEEFKTVNSGMTDFSTANITFDRIASNKRGEDIKASYTTQLISTDIQHCVENAEGLDNGVIFVLYELVNSENEVRYGKGQKSGLSVINGELSISSILAKYGTYEGTWQKGKINGLGINGLLVETDVYDFKYTSRTKVGKEITIDKVFTGNLIQISLGGKVSIGKCLKTIDFDNQNTKIVPYYRYSDNLVESGDMGDNPITAVLPTVITDPVAGWSYASGLCGGNVTSDGGAQVTERGICYGVNPLDITIFGNKEVEGTGTGLFTKVFYGLTSETLYYFRAYATNSVGTSYGDRYSFTTDIEPIM